MPTPPAYIATVLANGQSTRWGDSAPKSLAPWNGTPLIEHVLQRLTMQSVVPTQVWINSSAAWANEKYSHWPLLTDPVHLQHQGPLCGMLAALQKAPDKLHLFVPTDTPMLPLELAERLIAALTPDSIASVACVSNQDYHHSCPQIQPCCCLIRGAAVDRLIQYLETGQRSVLGWLKQIEALQVEFVHAPWSNFVNLNEPDQLLSLPVHPPAHFPDFQRDP